MSPTGPAVPGNAARREISRRTVSLLKEYVGRGPMSARTYVNGDLILVVLGDTLTKAERVLTEENRNELVREMRRAFMGTMRDRLGEVVEQETSRRVVTVLSDHSVDPDYAIVGCLLEAPAALADGGPAAEDRDADVRVQQRQISRGMSALYKESIGRGATESRTYIDPDVISVLLSGTLTRAELTLAQEERPRSVRELRRQFQGALEKRATAIVEEATGRSVIAFLSDHSIEPDYALEVFLMEPITESVDPGRPDSSSG